MKGDRIIVQPYHEAAARQLAGLMLCEITGLRKRFIVTIAGESGAGKSEIAAALADVLANHHVQSTILQQDDYFVYPPRTNAAMRRKDIDHVGPSEVRLGLMDENLKQVMAGAHTIVKPLVDFDADSIGEERVELDDIVVVLAEGTYTTLLENVHRRVFVDRTLMDTKEARVLRGREAQDDYLEQILAIEHEIISSHKPRADFVVTRDHEVTRNESRDQ
jgi:uridine kinase